VETSDGNAYTGRIVSETNESVTLNTETLGEITIKKINIARITPIAVSQVKDGVAWFENPQATRYFLQPNGYGLKKGEAYYQNVWIFFNQFSVGVSDNFSIGAGLVPVFLFGGEETPIWITPKFSIPIKKDKVNLGVGTLFGTVLGEESTSFGILYGVTTLGSRDRNCSIGFGWGYSDEGFADTPTVTLSALIRTGARGYFLTENYYIDNGGVDPLVLLSLGGRRMANRTGIDFGLFIPISNELDTFVAIPWLGISAPLNKKSTPTKKR
jgi:hypothetical protein